MRLPVIGQVQHAAYIPGASPSWAPPVPVDCHGWWPAPPETVPTGSVGELPEVTKLQLAVPEGTVCGHRDRWTVAGTVLEQVGAAADYSHGPFGLAAPLTVYVQSPAESLLTDTCHLQSPTGSSTDPETGFVTVGWGSYWSGQCRLTTDTAGQNSRPQPGGITAVSDLTLSLPLTAPAPAVGHRVLMASGLALFVTGGDAGTSLVLQRIPVSREVVADRA